MLATGALSTRADEAFRNHRYDSFKVLPELQKGDVVFIGNSITNQMNWDEALGRTMRVKNRGNSGGFTAEILENLESMIAGNPSKVFLMIGTNDLGAEGDDFTSEKVAGRIIEILKRMLVEAPGSEIYYQSILPTTRGLRTQEKTEATNSLVRRWIESMQMPKLQYVDLYSLLVAPDGSISTWSANPAPYAYSFDNLHLSQQGYRVWLKAIEDKVGLQCVFPENAPNLYGDLKGSAGMRLSAFGVEPTLADDILLLGDETIHNGEWEELTGSKDFKDRGIGWGLPSMSLSEAASTYDVILQGNGHEGVVRQVPHALVVYGGQTEILRGKSGREVANLYISNLKALKEKVPESTLFAVTILPLSTTDAKMLANIEEANNIIGSYAADNHLPLIDFHAAAMEDNGRNEALFMAVDSPYVSGMGYGKLAQAMVQAVNSALGTDYRALSDDELNDNLNRFYARTSRYNAQ